MPRAATKTPKKPAAKPPRYRPHPMLDMERRAKDRLRADTGRTWDQWIAATKKRGFSTTREARDWLVEEHGFSSMNAHWIAAEATRADLPDYGEPEPLVDALYSGEQAALRPLHEALVDEMLALGDDVVVTACKTMVPVYRKHVFAELRPGDGAVEVRLALGEGVPGKGRLERAVRMPGERLTHRVRVRRTADVDAELRRWLGAAFANGAGKMARSQEVDVPADFEKAVRAHAVAKATWASMTPVMRRDMVQWVTSAKQDETRERRRATALKALSSGKKRVY
jgi:Domain of unknown function (DUF5655)/Bacteriocin-protection, YdeI or OmpD-Associated